MCVLLCAFPGVSCVSQAKSKKGGAKSSNGTAAARNGAANGVASGTEAEEAMGAREGGVEGGREQRRKRLAALENKVRFVAPPPRNPYRLRLSRLVPVAS